jgi:hypothetical protein
MSASRGLLPIIASASTVEGYRAGIAYLKIGLRKSAQKKLIDLYFRKVIKMCD